MSWDGHDFEIYTINPDGSGRRQITHNTTNDMFPAYSPSGRRIAYSGYDGTDTEIYSIAIDGGARKRLTRNATPDVLPNVLPVGQPDRVCAVGRQRHRDLHHQCRRRQSGAHHRQHHRRLLPGLLPGGRWIAYSGDDGTDDEIYTINTDGSVRRQVTDNTSYDAEPRTPRRAAGSPTRERKAPAPSSRSTRSTPTAAGEARSPTTPATNSSLHTLPVAARSPTREPTDGLEIFRIRPNGGGRHRVTNNTTDDNAPDWGVRVRR